MYVMDTFMDAVENKIDEKEYAGYVSQWKFDFQKQTTFQIYVDDVRPVPSGYVGTKSVNETIALIETIESNGGKITCLDLDHDLGDYAKYGGDAIHLLDYLVMNEKFYPVQFHTANPVGEANMQRMIDRFWPDKK